MERALGGRLQARLGRLVDTLEGEGLVTIGQDGRIVGLLTWVIGGPDSATDEAEIRAVVLDPQLRGQGLGGELLAAAERALVDARAHAAWLVTTNDNVRALAFYQRHGWELRQLLPGAVDSARRTLKAQIPEIAENGIPMRDELVLAKGLGAAGSRRDDPST
jgi:ribosomal protein S18 acetylase RimI-like enzyme